MRKCCEEENSYLYLLKAISKLFNMLCMGKIRCEEEDSYLYLLTAISVLFNMLCMGRIRTALMFGFGIDG